MKSEKSPKIDIYDQSECARWARSLGVTEAKLKEAVRKFGTRPSTVRAGLGLPPV